MNPTKNEIKPTSKEVLDCNDEKQLSEWVAIICYGWIIEPVKELNYGTTEMCYLTGDDVMPTREYNPCSPTVEGESQCFRLLKKHGLDIIRGEGYVWTVRKSVLVYFDGWKTLAEAYDEDLQIAIVKAATISEVEK